MELTAVIKALEALKEPCEVRLVTDSKYVADGIGKGWAKSWRKNNWRKADKKPALNADLWEILLNLVESHRVEIEWVKGDAGSFNALDMIFGTAATLIAAILTYYLRNIKFKGLPLLAMLPPVIINAVVIGLEIAFFFLPEGFTVWGFVISGLEVGLGELIVCVVFGTPFYFLVKKNNIFKESE